MGKNIAQQLLAGSNNIDRMKQEIKETVNTLVGLIKKSGFSTYESYRQDFMFDGGFWRLQWNRYGFESVECNLLLFPDSLGTFVAFAPKTYTGDFNGWCINHTESVARVYDSLPVFVEGVFNFFPGVRERAQPLLDAADKF
jgi:hypothetical protein